MGRHRISLAVVVAGLASACTMVKVPTSRSALGDGVLGLTTNQPAPGSILSSFSGALVSNNSGSLVSNGAATLTGSVLAPTQLVGNNAAAYRVAALSNLPLEGALVYLSDTRERLYVDPTTGQTLTTTTDRTGSFDFPKAPATDSVVVDAVMSGNRRMVGFLDSHAGQNAITLTLASTLVTEFLRQQAQASGSSVTIGSFDPTLQHVPQLVALTQKALDVGALTVPDLSVGAIATMDRQYLVQFATQCAGLKQAWQSLLGFHIGVVQTLAGGQGGFAGDGSPLAAAEFSDPNGIALAPDGSIYVADAGNNRIRRIGPDGTVWTVAGGGDLAQIATRLAAGQVTDAIGDGGPATAAILEEPKAIVALPGGGFAFTEWGGQRVRLVLPDGTIETAVQGSVNDYGPSDGPLTGQTGHPNVIYPLGLAVGPDGALYVCDLGENVVRRIALSDQADPLAGATISTVAGDYDAGSAAVAPVDGAAATASALLNPSGLAFDATGDMYVGELEGLRIVEVTPDGRIYPFAGNGLEGATGDGGPATAAAIGSPTALLVDGANHRLIFGSMGTARIRAVDLDTGLITTLVGGGTDTDDGLAATSAVGDIGGMLLEPSGNLMFSELQTSRLRRLWLGEPTGTCQ